MWALHYGPETAKPYFDPLGLLDGVSLVWNSPPDHPWHHGLWFSWKGINGVNYWEEDGTTGRAEGLTEVVSAKVTADEDFSARIELSLAYHKPDEPAVLRETRVIAQFRRRTIKGVYTVDWRSDISRRRIKICCSRAARPAADTPGMSVRIASDTRDWRLIDGEGREDVPGPDPLAKNLHGQHARWMDLSLVHAASGQPAGSPSWSTPHRCATRHNGTACSRTRSRSAISVRRHCGASPTRSRPAKVSYLAYRIVVHPQRLSQAELEQRWKEYCAHL